MSQSKSDLKAEILTELRQEMGTSSGVTQYLNIGLLVVIGFFLGFFLGRRYERVWRTQVQPLAAAAAPAPRPGEPLPPDHPPLEEVGGGDPMAPVLALRARLEENPNDLEALIGLGNLNFDIGRMEASIGYYQRAIALDPRNADVITDMGLAQRNLGRIDDALQSFELAASVNPTHPQSRLNRAVVLLLDKGDHVGAIRAFEVYLALGPNVPRRAEIEQQLEQLRRMHGEEPQARDAAAREPGANT